MSTARENPEDPSDGEGLRGAPETRSRDGLPLRGLCPDCRHVKIVATDRGSTFLLCGRSRNDPRFSRYPPQPVVACAGFER